jgi:hypothetical protein
MHAVNPTSTPFVVHTLTQQHLYLAWPLSSSTRYLSFFDLGDVVSLQLSTVMGYAVVGKDAYSTPGALSNDEMAAVVKASAVAKVVSVVFISLILFQRVYVDHTTHHL